MKKKSNIYYLFEYTIEGEKASRQIINRTTKKRQCEKVLHDSATKLISSTAAGNKPMSTHIELNQNTSIVTKDKATLLIITTDVKHDQTPVFELLKSRKEEHDKRYV